MHCIVAKRVRSEVQEQKRIPRTFTRLTDAQSKAGSQILILNQPRRAYKAYSTVLKKICGEVSSRTSISSWRAYALKCNHLSPVSHEMFKPSYCLVGYTVCGELGSGTLKWTLYSGSYSQLVFSRLTNNGSQRAGEEPLWMWRNSHVISFSSPISHLLFFLRSLFQWHRIYTRNFAIYIFIDFLFGNQLERSFLAFRLSY